MDEKAKNHLTIWVIPSLCILAGTSIYLSCRTDILFMSWLGIKGNAIETAGNPLMEWLVFSLPDGLWYFALLWLQYAITDWRTAMSRLMMILSVLLPFVLEVLQAVRLLPGTFDWFDIGTYFLTLLIFIIMKKKKTFLFLAQALVIALFGFMALACASSQPTVKYNYRTERARANSCLGEGYVYVGTFNSVTEAEEASRRMGFSDYCYINNKCYGKTK